MTSKSKLYSKLSKSGFEILRVFDALVGLPKTMSETLQWRRHWAHYLQIPAEQGTLWIHGASVGELEDLASFYLNEDLLEASGYNFSRLVLTSSSISAANYLKKIQNSYNVLYAGPIPPEKQEDVDEFLTQLKPELFVLSHSDLWPLLITEAQKKALKKGILWLPAKATAAQKLFEKLVHNPQLTAVGYRQKEDLSALQLRLLAYSTKFVWIGNPRLDRILERIKGQQNNDQHALEKFRSVPDPTKISIIMGSLWPEDAVVFNEAYQQLTPEEQAKFQITALPHAHDDIHVVASIQHLLPYARVIATQGILLEAYQGFDVAYVGGAFKQGLHNILEPLLWSIPTLCGPRLKQQPEAPLLVQKNALTPVHSSEEMLSLLKNFLDPNQLKIFKDNAQKASQELSNAIGAPKRLSQLVSEFNNI